MLSQENLVVLRVKCLGYIDQRQTSVLPYSLYRTNPRGWGALKERFGRGVSPLPSNPDPAFKAAHDLEAHFF